MLPEENDKEPQKNQDQEHPGNGIETVTSESENLEPVPDSENNEEQGAEKA